MADVKQIDANGTTFTYSEAGSAQAPPVVLVHGSLGDYRTWRGEMRDFGKNYHVIAYSLRYHYPNGWSQGEYSIPLHVADLVALLKALNLGPVHLVGHSYGGSMAARVAKDNPELVKSLVLAEAGIPTLVTNKDEAKPLLAEASQVVKVAQEHVQKGEPDEGVAVFIGYVNSPAGGFKTIPSEFQIGMLENSSTVKPLLAGPPPPPFTCDDAKKISAPTLIVEGELTLKLRVLVDDELQRCIPNTSKATITGAAHPLEMINPQGFNAAVLEFLAKH
jgi:pimeloyl-ACP methyl ester carboxylesterase